MKLQLFLAVSMALLPFNYSYASADEQEIVIEQTKYESVSYKDLVLSIGKKLRNGGSLNHDEKAFMAFINILLVNTLTFGTVNGFLATSKLHLPVKESLYAAGIGAALGFVVGLPAAYFNASEWYD